MAKLKMTRGTTYNITHYFQKDGVASDITGATLRFTVKESEYDSSATDATAIITKDITEHTNQTGGVSNILIEPSDTAEVLPKTYYYDIKIEEADGSIYKTDEGTIIIDASPTNRTS